MSAPTTPFPRLRRLWYALRRPTTMPGRRFSYHRLLYLAAPLLLAVVLLTPLRVAGVIIVAVFLAWPFPDSLHRKEQREHPATACTKLAHTCSQRIVLRSCTRAAANNPSARSP